MQSLCHKSVKVRSIQTTERRTTVIGKEESTPRRSVRRSVVTEGIRGEDKHFGQRVTASEEIVDAPEVSVPKVEHGHRPVSLPTTGRIRLKGSKKSHFDRQERYGLRGCSAKKEHGDRGV